MGFDTIPLTVVPKDAMIDPRRFSSSTKDYLVHCRCFQPDDGLMSLYDFIHSTDAPGMHMRIWGYMDKEACEAWQELLVNAMETSKIREVALHFCCLDFDTAFVFYGTQTSVGPPLFVCYRGIPEDPAYFKPDPDEPDCLLFDKEAYLSLIKENKPIKWKEANFDGTLVRLPIHGPKPRV